MKKYMMSAIVKQTKKIWFRRKLTERSNKLQIQWTVFKQLISINGSQFWFQLIKRQKTTHLGEIPSVGILSFTVMYFEQHKTPHTTKSLPHSPLSLFRVRSVRRCRCTPIRPKIETQQHVLHTDFVCESIFILKQPARQKKNPTINPPIPTTTHHPYSAQQHNYTQIHLGTV